MNFDERTTMPCRPTDDKPQFICINCSNKISELYKTYSSSVLKVINCVRCNELADKYIEFEPIIIAIDLVLLSRPAQRHVLYNSTFQIHWKLNLVLLLLQAYILWQGKSHFFRANDENFTKEKLFYFCFGMAVIGDYVYYCLCAPALMSGTCSPADNFILLLLLRLGMFAAKDIEWRGSVKAESKLFILLLKSVTLANIAKFFLLPAVIWNRDSDSLEQRLNFSLVTAYYLYGLIQVFSGEIRDDQRLALYVY